MAKNIEIKARASAPERQWQLAEQISDSGPEMFEQEDSFFITQKGRLKLRTFRDGKGELIYYVRDDDAGPTESNYELIPTARAEPLNNLLEKALGVRAIVRKKRLVFMSGQTRIHLDDVDGLGKFIELEVVLKPGQNSEAGVRVAGDLMRALEIDEHDLIKEAYVDLLETEIK